jgi:hypothetical protein
VATPSEKRLTDHQTSGAMDLLTYGLRGKSKWVSDLRGDWPKRNAAQLHEPDLPEVLSGLSSQILPSDEDHIADLFDLLT